MAATAGLMPCMSAISSMHSTDIAARRERDAHPPPLVGVRLAEQPQVAVGNRERFSDVVKANAARVDLPVDDGGSAGRRQPRADRQAEKGARMQIEFALRLRA